MISYQKQVVMPYRVCTIINRTEHPNTRVIIKRGMINTFMVNLSFIWAHQIRDSKSVQLVF